MVEGFEEPRKRRRDRILWRVLSCYLSCRVGGSLCDYIVGEFSNRARVILIVFDENGRLKRRGYAKNEIENFTHD